MLLGQPIARYLAWRASSKGNEPLEDLYQEAMVALIECAARYREEIGPFNAYAAHRIRGRLADYRRKCDPLTRNMRRAVIEIDDTRRIAGDASDERLAALMGTTLSYIRNVAVVERRSRTISFDHMPSRPMHGAEVHGETTGDDLNLIAGTDTAVYVALCDAVERAFVLMTGRERYVMREIMRGTTTNDIATTMRLTAGRVSQIHGSAATKIEQELAY